MDVESFFESDAQLFLVVRLPDHVCDEVGRSKVLLGIAMAVEAPAHTEWFRLVDLVHLVDSPVAGDAANTAIHVSAVVEMDIVRKIMNPLPLNWLPRGLTLAHTKQLVAARVNCGSRYRAV